MKVWVYSRSSDPHPRTLFEKTKELLREAQNRGYSLSVCPRTWEWQESGASWSAESSAGCPRRFRPELCWYRTRIV